jgi:hypothetical protein
MTPQEREVIDSIFERLKPAASQPRDPEAERYIAELLRQQPYATYVLAQSAYVQEMALTNLSQENEQLKARLAEAEQKAAQPAQGGFLSSIFGGANPARQEPSRPFAPQGQPPQGGMVQGGAPQGGPWGGQNRMGMQPAEAQPQGGPWGGAQAGQQPAQRGGSGFLGTALTTVAGVAGGMVVGNMLMNAFKGSGSGHGESGAQSASSDFQPFPAQGGGREQEQHAANYADEGNREDYDTAADYDDGGYDDGGDSYDV